MVERATGVLSPVAEKQKEEGADGGNKNVRFRRRKAKCRADQWLMANTKTFAA